jgi:acyl-CoA reductase-like NAD-dependent aldehyde dehydrogenase
MQKLKIFSPYDNKLIKEIPLVGAKELEYALTTAYALFKDRSKWLPAYRRVEILECVAQIMSTRVEELTNIAAEEGGKPYNDSEVEVLRAINGVNLAIEHIGQMSFHYA